MKKLLIVLALLSTICSLSYADSVSFYGRNGYEGKAFVDGNTVTFYGGNGAYQGKAFVDGNTATFYGRNGYEGKAFGN